MLWVGLGLSMLAKGPVGPATALATAVGWWALGRRWQRRELLALVGLLVGGWLIGPVVLVVPLVAALLEMLANPAARQRLRVLRLSWGLPLLLGITLPWAIAAELATGGEFLRQAVGHHVLERATVALESHGGFPGFYPVTALLVALPWFPFLFAALASSPRPNRFLIAWLLGPLVMFELTATKLVHYWLPAYPAGVLLVLSWAWPDERPFTERAARWLPLWAAAMLAAVPAAVAFLPGAAALLGPGLLSGLPLLAAAALAARPRLRPRTRLLLVGAGCALLALALTLVYLPRLGDLTLPPRAADRLLAHRRAGEALVVYRARDDELFFHLPLATLHCRSAGCLRERRGAWLGLCREEQLAEVAAAVKVEVIETVAGVDLTHGRQSRCVVIRPQS